MQFSVTENSGAKMRSEGASCVLCQQTNNGGIYYWMGLSIVLQNTKSHNTKYKMQNTKTVSFLRPLPTNKQRWHPLLGVTFNRHLKSDIFVFSTYLCVIVVFCANQQTTVASNSCDIQSYYKIQKHKIENTKCKIQKKSLHASSANKQTTVASNSCDIQSSS